MPVDLPNRALTQSDVEKLWSRDRARLKECFGTVEVLQAYIDRLGVEFNGAAL